MAYNDPRRVRFAARTEEITVERGGSNFANNYHNDESSKEMVVRDQSFGLRRTNSNDNNNQRFFQLDSADHRRNLAISDNTRMAYFDNRTFNVTYGLGDKAIYFACGAAVIIAGTVLRSMF